MVLRISVKFLFTEKDTGCIFMINSH